MREPTATITKPQGLGSRAQLFVLLTGSAGCAMTVLDSNIVAVILPSIARDYSASFAQIEWVISAYVLCFASLLMPAGAIADRFGRRGLFFVGIAAFAISSLLCGAAPTPALLYLARAFQGLAAAFLLAPALAIIAHAFHEEKARNQAWAIWGTIMGLTMVLSPITGGLITYLLGWRWAFYINVPICLALGVAAFLCTDESSDEFARRLDPWGIVAFASTMFALTWGLINGQAHGWGSMACLGGLIGAAIALTIFIVVERAQERPMLDLTLFTNPRLVGSVLAMFAYAACAQVMTSLLPPFLQNGMGMSAVGAGAAMLPFALAMLIFPHVGRRLGGRLTSAQILSLGLAVVALGNGLTGWASRMGNWPLVAIGLLVIGSGGGLLNGETQKAIMADVPRSRAGMASGLSTTARFSGILLGFALLSGVLASVTRSILLTGATDAGIAHRIADAVVAGETSVAADGLSGVAARAAIRSAREAYADGFSIALWVAASLALLSAIAVRILSRRSRAARTVE